jgi:UDP-glucose 4-epimerase
LKRVLITGGAGFIGANLTRMLLDKGFEIHLLLRPGSDLWRISSILHNVIPHHLSILDRDKLRKTLGMIRPEWIFHLASNGNSSLHANPSKIMETNITGTIGLVEICSDFGFEAFIHAGSSSEYGFKDHPPQETERLEPNSYYAVAKASATLFCSFWAQKYGADITTLRIYAAYGPYEDPARFVPMLAVNGLQKRFPPLVRPGVARDFVYVEDVCEAFIKSAEIKGAPGRIFNVGTGIQTTIRDAVRSAQRILRIEEPPRWGSMPDRRWDTNVWLADNRKITEEIGWVPRHGFEDGFIRTIRWLESVSGRLDLYRGRQAPTEPLSR